ncbi:hypothetical protein ABE288_19160 [Bacillus salipaludis]|uniref:Uncharacterized protein n=1 Tax=Bacillus salipaludis TaxID=2547811 RepID=A0AA90TRR6_9BACI|nr:hypothetical protein [Bacillus salipaludis]MDQ6600151.1 hypothetical protein [Bacillus salipaludis]MED1468819.1 hypothetical protein [Bacillus salipaludis]
MSYSIDPDPSRRGEVNVIFELIELVSTRISALEKVVGFLKNE